MNETSQAPNHSYQPATYNELLHRPDVHPDLMPHIERLALESGESIDQHRWTGLDTLNSRLQTEQEDLQHEDLSASYYAADSDIYASIAKGDYLPKDLAAFVRLSKDISHAYGEAGKDGGYDLIFDALSHAPKEHLQQLYHSPYSTPLREMIEDVRSQSEVIKAADLLKKVYGLDFRLDLADKDSILREDPTVQQLIAHKLMAKALTEELWENTPAWSDESTPDEANTAIREWGKRFLRDFVGLPSNISSELRYSSYSRTTNPDDGSLNKSSYAIMLEKTAQNVSEVGLERIELLNIKAGISNLDYYDADQLEITARVLEGDISVIKHLQEGDVTVVFTDTWGDHNGALSSVGKEYRTRSNSSLFFEIDKPSDFYRHFIRLRSMGIRPSTVSINTHGKPGMMYFGDKLGSFKLTNKHPTDIDKPTDELPIASFKELIQEIAGDFMRNSRGIDDHPAAKGKRRIILSSCSQAAPVSIKRESSRVRPQRFMPFSKKTIGAPAQVEESMAHSLASQINDPRVEIYAGDETLGVKTTEQGIRFQSYNSQEYIPAVRYRTNKKGVVEVSHLEEILLYKEPRDIHNE